MTTTASRKQRKRYVVQAWGTSIGWVDTQYQHNQISEVYAFQTRLLNNDSSWLPGERKTRLVDRTTNVEFSERTLCAKLLKGNDMQTFKTRDLVQVQVPEFGYRFMGQVIEGDTSDAFAVECVPGIPGFKRCVAHSDNMVRLNNQPKHVWVHFAQVVAGGVGSMYGSFPTDMLRHDYANPANFELEIDDFRVITKPTGKIRLPDLGLVFSGEPDALIIVSTTLERREPWTPARWASFMWVCKPLNTIKVQR